MGYLERLTAMYGTPVATSENSEIPKMGTVETAKTCQGDVLAVLAVPHLGISEKISPPPMPRGIRPDLELMRRIRELFDDGPYCKISLMALVAGLTEPGNRYHARDRARVVNYLRGFGIEPRTLTIGGYQVEGYESEQFRAAFDLCRSESVLSKEPGLDIDKEQSGLLDAYTWNNEGFNPLFYGDEVYDNGQCFKKGFYEQRKTINASGFR